MNIYYKISAPAKLNLNLFVKHKMFNGLHFLESDICFLELADEIFIRNNDKEMFFQNSNNAFLINSKDNLILSAVKKFKSFANWNKNFEIYLDKKIPIGAGLGGGSANAAATLILLRKLFNKENKIKKVSLYDLLEIGSELGSDVPACLISKDLKLNGYSKEIKRKNFPNGYFFLIVNPNVQLSTKEVFNQFSYPDNLENNCKLYFFNNIKIYNSLISSAISLVPEISDILTNISKIPKVLAYGMSGSGSTCFGIFENLIDISKFKKYFNKNYYIWYGQKKNYNLNRVRFSKVLENKY